jgi:hypothetical protein
LKSQELLAGMAVRKIQRSLSFRGGHSTSSGLLTVVLIVTFIANLRISIDKFSTSCGVLNGEHDELYTMLVELLVQYIITRSKCILPSSPTDQLGKPTDSTAGYIIICQLAITNVVV